MFAADMIRCRQDGTRKACGDFSADLRAFNGEDDHLYLLPGTRRMGRRRRS